MQRTINDISPANIINDVFTFNQMKAKQDEVITIEGRSFAIFQRMTTQGYIKSFQEPLESNRL